jgi:hypothetical protein
MLEYEENCVNVFFKECVFHVFVFEKIRYINMDSRKAIR